MDESDKGLVFFVLSGREPNSDDAPGPLTRGARPDLIKSGDGWRWLRGLACVRACRGLTGETWLSPANSHRIRGLLLLSSARSMLCRDREMRSFVCSPAPVLGAILVACSGSSALDRSPAGASSGADAAIDSMVPDATFPLADASSERAVEDDVQNDGVTGSGDGDKPESGPECRSDADCGATLSQMFCKKQSTACATGEIVLAGAGVCAPLGGACLGDTDCSDGQICWSKPEGGGAMSHPADGLGLCGVAIPDSCGENVAPNLRPSCPAGCGFHCLTCVCNACP
jgi:hypothetical protein